MQSSGSERRDEGRGLYLDYPFPSRAWHQLQRLKWLPAGLRTRLMKKDYQRKVVREIRAHVPAPARILDAGCGLAENGRLVLYFYGELGRARVRAGLELLEILVPDVRDVGTKVDLAGRMDMIPPPTGRVLHRLSRRVRGLDPHWANASYVADSYAHPRAHEHNAAQILELLDQTGLELDCFIGDMRNRPEEVWSDPQVLDCMRKLPADKLWRAIELAIQPAGYRLICKRA